MLIVTVFIRSDSVHMCIGTFSSLYSFIYDLTSCNRSCSQSGFSAGSCTDKIITTRDSRIRGYACLSLHVAPDDDARAQRPAFTC